MKKSYLMVILSLAVLAAVVIILARPSRFRDEEVLALVGNERITVEQMRRVWDSLPEPAEVSPGLILQSMIEDKMFLTLARSAGIERTARFEEELAAARENLMVDLLLEKEIFSIPPPGEEEVEAFWRDHAADFMVPELIRVSHLLIRFSPDEKGGAVETARNLLARLREGEDFAELVRRYSQADSAPRGGDLGFFRPRQLLPELEGVARGLEAGGFAGPIRTDLGYHLVKVTDRRDARARSLDAARDEVVSALLLHRQRERMARLRERAEELAPVWVDEVSLERLRAEWGEKP